MLDRQFLMDSCSLSRTALRSLGVCKPVFPLNRVSFFASSLTRFVQSKQCNYILALLLGHSVWHGYNGDSINAHSSLLWCLWYDASSRIGQDPVARFKAKKEKETKTNENPNVGTGLFHVHAIMTLTGSNANTYCDESICVDSTRPCPTLPLWKTSEAHLPKILNRKLSDILCQQHNSKC